MTDSTVIDPPASSSGGDPRGEVAGGGWRLGLLAAGTVAIGLFGGRGWLFIIAALSVMIFLHELGHYLTAKWSGMKVTEFFLFFGPKLWSFRRGETEYGIKLIPLGAYVRIIGMNNLDECPPEDEPRTYRQQSFPKRMLVITAGSMMHFAQALVIFFLLFAAVGVPGDSRLARDVGGPAPEWVVNNVVDGSGAAAAGLELGDRILSIGGGAVTDFSDIGPLVADRVGDPVPVVVERGGERVELTARIGPHPEDPAAGFLGVGAEYLPMDEVTIGPARAAIEAGAHVGDAMWRTVDGIGSLLTGGLGSFADSVADGTSERGPVISPGGGGEGRDITEGDESRIISMVGIARWGADASEDGVADFLLLLAFINVSIGILNLLPLLPLDGGHAAVAIYERFRSFGGRRHMADVSRLIPLTYGVVAILLLVSMSAVYLDIVDPLSPG